MKPSKTLFEETMQLLNRNGYRLIYVPHKIIEDYNAAYDVLFEGKPITTGASKRLGIPLSEIWISDMWKPYEKFVLFHELREIYYRAKGVDRDEAHEKSIEDGVSLWSDDPLWQKMRKEIEEMDKKTAEKKGKQVISAF